MEKKKERKVYGKTNSAASAKSLALFAANCTTKGRSFEQVVNSESLAFGD